jgi:hypothetical protein
MRWHILHNQKGWLWHARAIPSKTLLNQDKWNREIFLIRIISQIKYNEAGDKRMRLLLLILLLIAIVLILMSSVIAVLTWYYSLDTPRQK